MADDLGIRNSLLTVSWLIERGEHVTVRSHLSRPHGRADPHCRRPRCHRRLRRVGPGVEVMENPRFDTEFEAGVASRLVRLARRPPHPTKGRLAAVTPIGRRSAYRPRLLATWRDARMGGQCRGVAAALGDRAALGGGARLPATRDDSLRRLTPPSQSNHCTPQHQIADRPRVRLGNLTTGKVPINDFSRTFGPVGA